MNFSHITPMNAPSGWLNLDALEHNINTVNENLNGKKLRLATKSIRCIEVLRYIIHRSPDYIGLMSYSAKESAYLLNKGFDDILCAYPTLDEASIIETFDYVKQGAKMTWMVDRIEHWQLLEKLARKYDVEVLICIDINMSMPLPKLYFGTKRSSVMQGRQLKKLLKLGKDFHCTKITGLMGYEGQIAGLPESLPNKAFLAPAIRVLKKRSKQQVSKRRKDMVNILNKHLKKSKQATLSLVNGGGSGSLEFTCSQSEVSEITVGSAYYCPTLFDYMDSMKAFQPSAGFVLQVTRQPEQNVITCHSGGFVASGPCGEDKLPSVHYPKNLEIRVDEGFGEVQTPMVFTDGKPSVKIGDYVWCRHAKAGELCEHFNELCVYENGILVGKYPTYRGEGQAFH